MTAFSSLGPEWPFDDEGFPHRQAARIVVFDSRGRILLARGHDRDQPERSWWFTIGGGLGPDEDPKIGALRELAEETGLSANPEDLIGPVLYRSAEFDFLSVTARQDEWFFLLHLSSVAPGTSDDGWTDLERDVIDEHRWWDIEDLAAEESRAEVYPRGLSTLARQWLAGWDGVLHHIAERKA